MRTLLALIGKDVRLLWRDRAGLIFLTIAPIMVITVAGFSLANLYGADPTGQTAYELPLVDEDQSTMGRTIYERLARERAVRVRPVRDRAEAERLVTTKRAGSALVIPRGTEQALQAGQPAALVLYADPAKYLERLNVRTRLLELRDALAAEQREQAARIAVNQRDELAAQLRRLQDTLTQARTQLDASWAAARDARSHAIAHTRQRLAQAEREIQARLETQLAAAVTDATAQVSARADAMRSAASAYFTQLAQTQQAFAVWLADLRRLAGDHAADIPVPPVLPPVPAALRSLAAPDDSALRPPALHLALPPLPAIDLPPLPAPPALAVPSLALPPAPVVPPSLTIEEVNVTGGPTTINTFDQNVPGFSVTFLLLGMLLGVSLGLLDERDWGTFDRLRAMPIAGTQVLVAKLLARFFVGVVQMVVLLAVGWLAFGMSLGRQPAALLLPTVGIVFAGTAFGLVVAAVATSREAVLPVGSIVIVTMAAVGGCWWPIDLEPRWMRSVALAFPTTWAMDAFNDLMIRRRPASVALVPTAVMLAYGTLYLVVGAFLFSRRARAGRG